MAMTDAAIRDNTAFHRFEMNTEAGPAFVTYRHGNGVVTLIHTEVPKALAGRGVGSALAAGVLDLIRSRGEKVVPRCEFMRGYIERHPDYAELVK
jgi:predicted GNAT family acetyltransferase